MSSGSGRRLSGVTAVIFTVLAIECGTALAAPPEDPPGNSGDAPGHQKQEPERSGPPATPPGQEKKETDAVAAPQAASTPAPGPAPAPASDEPAANANAKPAPAHTNAPAESPRYTNGDGKPKRNVPAEAEAAPESSVSGPGNSGVHKVTICHNGHAITVDVHATGAHVGRHGDPYLPAGTKHRAACGTHTSGSTPPPTVTNDPRDPEEMNDPRDADATNPVADPRTTSSTSQGSTSQGGTSPGSTSPGAPAVPGLSADPGDPEDAGASTSTTHERGGSDSATLAALPALSQLPFTGAALTPLILIGFGLIGAGAFLLRAGSEATPAAARARMSRRRRAAS